MNPEMFTSWGWHIPFLLSGALIGAALSSRHSMQESPVFEAARESKNVARSPLGTLLREHLGTVALAGAIAIAPPASGYIYSVYLLSYSTTQLDLNRKSMLGIIIIGAFVPLVTVYLRAIRADRFTQKKVFIAGAILLCLRVLPLFMLVGTVSAVMIMAAVAVVLIAPSIMAGPHPSMIAVLFPTEVRDSGASVSYQIGSTLGRGSMPMIAIGLYAVFGSSTPISVYLLSLGIPNLVGIMALRTGRYSASAF